VSNLWTHVPIATKLSSLVGFWRCLVSAPFLPPFTCSSFSSFARIFSSLDLVGSVLSNQVCCKIVVFFFFSLKVTVSPPVVFSTLARSLSGRDCQRTIVFGLMRSDNLKMEFFLAPEKLIIPLTSPVCFSLVTRAKAVAFFPRWILLSDLECWKGPF